jgi:hypothetical protein
MNHGFRGLRGVKQKNEVVCGLGGHPKPAMCGHLKTGHTNVA